MYSPLSLKDIKMPNRIMIIMIEIEERPVRDGDLHKKGSRTLEMTYFVLFE